jgi:hypothetical protein
MPDWSRRSADSVAKKRSRDPHHLDNALQSVSMESLGPFLIAGRTIGFALNPLFAASVIFRG